MIKQKYKKILADIGIGTALATVIPLYMLISSSQLTWDTFLKEFLLAFIAGYTVIELLPVLSISEKVARKISHATFNTIVKNAVIAMLLSLCVGSISTIVKHGVAELPNSFSHYPQIVLITFLIFSFWIPILLRLIEKYSEKDSN